MNIALDYSWACADREWQQEYGNKIQNFLYGQGLYDFKDQYNVDGSPVKEVLQAGEYKQLRHSLGLVATAAAVSLVCTDVKCEEFVKQLWEAKHEPYEDGYLDKYYDGLLRFVCVYALKWSLSDYFSSMIRVERVLNKKSVIFPRGCNDRLFLFRYK